jgi:O-antigen ligase
LNLVKRNLGQLSLTFRVLWLFLIAVMLLGGGSRSDIYSLIILRPLAVGCCIFGLWRLQHVHFQAHRGLLLFALSIFVLVGLQLVPLPPAIWHALPGRAIISEVDRVAGLGDVWRPFTVAPDAGWNAFYALFVPLAVLVLGVQIEREERFLLLPLFIGYGVLTACIGIFQLTNAGSIFYFYDITNTGLSTGMFANRNHHAVYLACMFPMLAVYASPMGGSRKRSQMRLPLCLCGVLLLVPLILITASRAGLIVGTIGLGAIFALISLPADLNNTRRNSGDFWGMTKAQLITAAGALIVIAVAAISIFYLRGTALQRLLDVNNGDARSSYWTATMAMLGDYFPVGSGFGSFVETFKIGEPHSLLGPSYINHAHNDFLELALTGGLPAAILFLIAAVYFLRSSLKVWSGSWGGMFAVGKSSGLGKRVQLARMGSVIILMLAIASAVDYPLRTPVMSAFLIVQVLWLHAGMTRDGDTMQQK